MRHASRPLPCKIARPGNLDLFPPHSNLESGDSVLDWTSMHGYLTNIKSPLIAHRPTLFLTSQETSRSAPHLRESPSPFPTPTLEAYFPYSPKAYRFPVSAHGLGLRAKANGCPVRYEIPFFQTLLRNLKDTFIAGRRHGMLWGRRLLNSIMASGGVRVITDGWLFHSYLHSRCAHRIFFGYFF